MKNLSQDLSKNNMRFFFLLAASLWASLLSCADEGLRCLTNYEKAQIVQNLRSFDEGKDLHFIDLDGDGRDEVIVALRGVDSRYGCQWLAYAVGGDLKLTEISDSKNSEFFFHILGAYIAELANGRKLLVCRDFMRGPDCYNLFYLNREGCVVRIILKNGIDDILRNPDFISLKRAYRKEGVESKERELPDDHRELLRANYISTLQASGFDTKDCKVMIVDMGINKDGIRVIYVSSPQEKLNGDKYRWHLYLENDSEIVRLEDKKVYAFRTNFTTEALLSTCEVSQGAFYTVKTSSEKSIPIVAEFSDNHLTSKAFPLIVQEDELKMRSLVLSEEGVYDEYENWRHRVTEDEWSAGYAERLNVNPPKDLRHHADMLFYDSVQEIRRAKSYELY